MKYRTLSSGQEVSVISIGCWQTFENLEFDQSVAVLDAAFDAGINFFDTARYAMVPPNERGESQPIPPGSPHSELIFGRAMAETGRDRDDYVLSEKVWFDRYPAQPLMDQLDASIRRTGLGYVDVTFVQVPIGGTDVATLTREMSRLVTEGRSQTWGTINWSPAQLTESVRLAEKERLVAPALVELKYSAVRRNPAESEDYERVLGELGIAIHASCVFEGGLLTGKYSAIHELSARRILPEDRDGARASWEANRDAYAAIAKELDTSPAQLAVAYTIANPRVASALIGATRPEQVRENAAAVELVERDGQRLQQRVRSLAPLPIDG